MSKTWIGVCGLIAGAVLIYLTQTAGPAVAQSTGGPAGRAVCIDIITIFDEYELQKDLTDEMRQVDQEIKTEAAAREQRINQLKAALDRIQLDDPTYAERAEELMREQIDFKNWLEFKQLTAQREAARWTAKIFERVRGASQQIAEQRGYDMVLIMQDKKPGDLDPQVVREQMRSRRVMYCSPQVNITQDVLDLLNEQYRAEPRKQLLQIP